MLREPVLALAPVLPPLSPPEVDSSAAISCEADVSRSKRDEPLRGSALISSGCDCAGEDGASASDVAFSDGSVGFGDAGDGVTFGCFDAEEGGDVARKRTEDDATMMVLGIG